MLLAGGILLYRHYSSSNANATTQAAGRSATTKAKAPIGCTHSAASPPVTSPDGQMVDAVLHVPTLDLVAPVLQGVDDPQLAVGVGHVPASSWPGFTGTDVLSAHDVTWFSQIDRLKTGDRIAMVTPCHTFEYTVVNHRVVQAGSPVYQSTHGRLVLATSYPLNALSTTRKRYLVEASLAAVTNSGTVTAPATVAPTLPTVPAPPALAAQGLDLAHNKAPLGVLTLHGSPTRQWQQSEAPLKAEALALQLYFAALRSANQDEPSWWEAIGPGVPIADAGPLVGRDTPTTAIAIHPTLDMHGATLVGATVTCTLRVHATSYVVTLTAAVAQGQLVMTKFSMQPTG